MAEATFEEQIKDFLEHTELELQHSGVKGMRWGHRRAALKVANANVDDIFSGKRRGMWHDPTSRKTTILDNSASNTAVLSGASLLVSGLSRNPKVKIGAKIVSGILAGSSITLRAASHRSSINDRISAYGPNGSSLKNNKRDPMESKIQKFLDKENSD